MINYKMYIGVALLIGGMVIAINSTFVGSADGYVMSSQPIAPTSTWCATQPELTPNYNLAVAVAGIFISAIGGIITSAQFLKSDSETIEICSCYKRKLP